VDDTNANPDPRYTRSTFRLPGNQRLAAAIMGHEITASMGAVDMATGVVTDCRMADDGDSLWVTLESGGRACGACRHVYPEADAATELCPASTFREDANKNVPWALVHQDLPDWTPVCLNWETCHRRQTDQ